VDTTRPHDGSKTGGHYSNHMSRPVEHRRSTATDSGRGTDDVLDWLTTTPEYLAQESRCKAVGHAIGIANDENWDANPQMLPRLPNSRNGAAPIARLVAQVQQRKVVLIVPPSDTLDRSSESVRPRDSDLSLAGDAVETGGDPSVRANEASPCACRSNDAHYRGSPCLIEPRRSSDFECEPWAGPIASARHQRKGQHASP
jgi:hypothetical protein